MQVIINITLIQLRQFFIQVLNGNNEQKKSVKV